MKSWLLSLWVLVVALVPALGATRKIPTVSPVVGTPSGSPVAPLAPSIHTTGGLPGTLAPAAAAGETLHYNALVPVDVEPIGIAGVVGLPSKQSDTSFGELEASLRARGATGVLKAIRTSDYRDHLTGLFTRKYFEEQGEEEIKKYDNPLIAILDMDNFGPVNVGLATSHGTVEGRELADGLLVHTGAVFSESATKHGVMAARLGGEEFVVSGPARAVINFCSDVQNMLPPLKLLEAAGISRADLEGIHQVQERVGRAGQPIGSFTIGAAAVEDMTIKRALEDADLALNEGKKSGKRGKIQMAMRSGGIIDWPIKEQSYVGSLPPPKARRSIARVVSSLEKKLTPDEIRLYRDAMFRDSLTNTRTYPYVNLRLPVWNRELTAHDEVALISARNLKQINDILGHAIGDEYLRVLGKIIREESSGPGLRLEVVRVASKEFLIIGPEAGRIAEKIGRLVAGKLMIDQMTKLEDSDTFKKEKMFFIPSEIRRLDEEAVKEPHNFPRDRIGMIGTLRIVSKKLDDGSGRVNVQKAIDTTFDELEVQKRKEEKP